MVSPGRRMALIGMRSSSDSHANSGGARGYVAAANLRCEERWRQHFRCTWARVAAVDAEV